MKNEANKQLHTLCLYISFSFYNLFFASFFIFGIPVCDVYAEIAIESEWEIQPRIVSTCNFGDFWFLAENYISYGHPRNLAS